MMNGSCKWYNGTRVRDARMECPLDLLVPRDAPSRASQ